MKIYRAMMEVLVECTNYDEYLIGYFTDKEKAIDAVKDEYQKYWADTAIKDEFRAYFPVVYCAEVDKRFAEKDSPEYTVYRCRSRYEMIDEKTIDLETGKEFDDYSAWHRWYYNTLAEKLRERRK